MLWSSDHLMTKNNDSNKTKLAETSLNTLIKAQKEIQKQQNSNHKHPLLNQ